LRGPARFARNLVLRSRNEKTALNRFDWLYGETALSSLPPRAGV